ncbi:TPA: hypothetical protein ACRSAD_001122 [Klebsiella quasipneumoniae]
MTDAELAHTKELAFWMTERVFMNPISAKLLNEDWRKAFPDEVAIAERMKALVEALEKAQGMEAYWKTQCRGITDHCEVLQARIAELESCTVKLPDGWQFEECEIEGCENGAIFSVGTGSRNIHLCDKCAHEPQNSRLKKSPLSKRLPFKMSAGIKVEAE